MQKAENAFGAGHWNQASTLVDEAFGLAQPINPDAAMYIARRVQDMCFRSWDVQCVQSYQGRLKSLVDLALDSPDRSQAIKAAIFLDEVERYVRMLLMLNETDQAIAAASKIDAIHLSPFAAPLDFIQVNITWANVALAKGDVALAGAHTERALTYFLSSKNMQEAEFIRFLPEIVLLLRQTGQIQKALYLATIAEKTLFALVPHHVYEGIYFLMAQSEMLGERGNWGGTAKTLKDALDLSESAEVPASSRLILRGAMQVVLLTACTIPDLRDCLRPDTVSDANMLIGLGVNATSDKTVAPFRTAALAIAMNSLKTGKPISAEVRRILDVPPAKSDSILQVAQQSVYYMGQSVLALARNDTAEAKSQLSAAAQSELRHVDGIIAQQPFSVAPVNMYTRQVFMWASEQIAPKTTLSDPELEELLEIGSHLNRSNRNVESRYLYLLSRAENHIQAISLQALHRTEQNLLTLEKQVLSELVQELWGRKPGRENAKFDTSSWTRFGELGELKEGYDDTSRWAKAIMAEPKHVLADVRRSLRPDERYVTNFIADNHLIRICMGSDTVSTGVENLNGTESGKLKVIAAALTSQGGPNDVLDSRFPLIAAKQITDLMLGSDSSCLGDAAHVLFAPPEEFLAIPMHVLIDPCSRLSQESIDEGNIGSVNWLGTKRAISMILDTDELVASRMLSGHIRYAHAFLGVGDPRLDGTTEDGEQNSQVALRGVRPGAGAQLAKLENLPDTAAELKLVAHNFGPTSELLLGDNSTELDVRRKLLVNYGIISFATHGLVREELEGISEPTLVLTPRDSKWSMNDGLLTATEISQLDLSADLVILSACNTADFRQDVFGPEAAALSTSFFLSGARAVLASLWSVNSAATKSLMDFFSKEYAKNKDRGAAEALRVGINNFIRSAPPELRHPRNWAAFSIFGDGGGVGANSDLGARSSISLVALKGDGGQYGEFVRIISGPDGPVVAGVLIGNSFRATGSLTAIKPNGEVIWEVKDAERSFVPATNRAGSNVAVLAWNYHQDGLKSDLSLRTYERSSGRLIYDRAIDAEKFEVPAALLALPNGGYISASNVGDIGSNNVIALRRMAEDGRVISQVLLPKEETSRFATVRLFALKRGFLLASLENDSKRVEKGHMRLAGLPELCSYPLQTRLRWYSDDLHEMRSAAAIANMELQDLILDKRGRMAIALTRFDPCTTLHYSSVLGIETLRGIELKEIKIPGVYHRPLQLRYDDKGRLIVLGNMIKAIDYFRPLSEDYATIGSRERDRQYTSTRLTGAYVAVIETTTNSRESLELFFAGANMYIDDLWVNGSKWLGVGQVGGARLVGEIRYDPSRSRQTGVSTPLNAPDISAVFASH